MIKNITDQAGGRIIGLPGHTAGQRWLYIELRGQRVGDLTELAERIHRDLGRGTVYQRIHSILDHGIERAT